MRNLLDHLKDELKASNIGPTNRASKADVELFQLTTGLVLPQDFVDYFTELNGSSDDYDSRFFKFYSLSEFVRVKDELSEWKGAPDYRNIVNTMTFHQNCFVFSDYNFHAFTYAIQLYSKSSQFNEVYVLMGDKYKFIASSFLDFIKLYLNDSSELYFSE